MTAQNPPIFLQAGSHPAEDVRREQHAELALPRSCIVESGDLAVSQNGTPNLSVNVAGGRAYVVGTEATYQGAYFVENRGVTNLAIAAADPTNPRRDLVIARVRDAAYSGVTNAWALEVVTGTPAASPSDPAVPANSYVLARVTVAALDTTITNADITDLRQQGTTGLYAARGGTVICTSTTRPTAALYAGLAIFESDTGRFYHYTGSAWRYERGGTDPTAAHAWGSGATSIGTTPTLVALATELYDYGNNFSGNTYTCPRAGLLEVQGRVGVTGTTDNQRMFAMIYKNGAEASRGDDGGNGGVNARGSICGDLLDVAAGDLITLRAQFASGAAANTDTSSAAITWLTCRMRP